MLSSEIRSVAPTSSRSPHGRPSLE